MVMAWQDFNRRIKSANAIILNAEKRYGKDSKIVQSIYKSISYAYGTESVKRRFSLPPTGAKLIDVAKIDRALKRVELSNSLTKEGRKRTYEKSRDTWAKNNPDMDISNFDKFITAKEELGSLIYGESEQILNELDMLPETLTKKDFKAIVKSYNKAMINGEFSEGEEPNFFEYLRDEGSRIINDKLEKSNRKQFYGL